MTEKKTYNQKRDRSKPKILSVPEIIKNIEECYGNFLSYGQLMSCGALSESDTAKIKTKKSSIFNIPHITFYGGIQRWPKSSVLDWLKK